MDRFKTMESFLQVVRAGSFTAAADQMAMSRSMITRHIQALEDRLGARLLHRTTRFVKLTEVGTAYLGYCQSLLDEIEERERTIVKSQAQLQGPLKVSASRGFGTLCVADAVAQFSLEHEHVGITLLIGDFSPRAYDFVEHGFHLAIRFSPNRDSAITSRRIGVLSYVICASPGYLKTHGRPTVPADLLNHKCLSHSHLDGGIWKLKGPKGLESIRITGTFSSNLSLVLRTATLAGLGISMLPRHCADEDLKKGRLVELLRNYKAPERPVYVLLPHTKFMPATTRAFVEFLAHWFKGSRSPLQ